MLKNNRLLLISTIAFIMIGAAACGSSSGGGGDKKTELTLLSQPGPPAAASFMAKENGYYEEEGLNVSIRQMESGTTALQSWTSGLGDVVFSGNFSGLNHYSQTGGEDLRFIQVAGTENSLALMARKGIDDVSDLIGKSVAILQGSESEWMLDKVLASEQIDKGKLDIVNLKPDQMTAALDKGDIDAFSVFQPYGWVAETTLGDDVKELEIPDEYKIDYTMYSARPSELKEHPEVYKSFMKATKRGVDWVVEHPEETAKYYADTLGLKASTAKEELDILIPHWAKDDFGEFTKSVKESTQDLTDWGIDNNILDENVNLEDVIWKP